MGSMVGLLALALLHLCPHLLRPACPSGLGVAGVPVAGTGPALAAPPSALCPTHTGLSFPLRVTDHSAAGAWAKCRGSPGDLPRHPRPILHISESPCPPLRLHTASPGPTSGGRDPGADRTAPAPAASPGPAQSPPGAGRPSRRAGRCRAQLGLPGTALRALTGPGPGTLQDTRPVAGTGWSLCHPLPLLLCGALGPPPTPQGPTRGSPRGRHQRGSLPQPSPGVCTSSKPVCPPGLEVQPGI